MKAGIIRGLVILSLLFLFVAPDKISIFDFGTLNSLDKNEIMCELALPSTGVAVMRSLIRLSNTSVNWSFGELGKTRIFNIRFSSSQLKNMDFRLIEKNTARHVL